MPLPPARKTHGICLVESFRPENLNGAVLGACAGRVSRSSAGPCLGTACSPLCRLRSSLSQNVIIPHHGKTTWQVEVCNQWPAWRELCTVIKSVSAYRGRQLRKIGFHAPHLLTCSLGVLLHSMTVSLGNWSITVSLRHFAIIWQFLWVSTTPH